MAKGKTTGYSQTDATPLDQKVGLFGAIAIMECADEVTHVFEQ